MFGHDRALRIERLAHHPRDEAHIAAELSLDGRLAVAEHIPDDAEARIDVVPARNAVESRQAVGIDERTGERRHRIRFRAVVFVADAEVQRHAVQRPLILREDARDRAGS